MNQQTLQSKNLAQRNSGVAVPQVPGIGKYKKSLKEPTFNSVLRKFKNILKKTNSQYGKPTHMHGDPCISHNKHSERSTGGEPADTE